MKTNAAIIYKSKYGATRTYARWISNKLNCDIFEAGNVSLQTLLNYDSIIFAGALYASKLTVRRTIKKTYKKLNNKNLYCIVVGLTDTKNKEVYQAAVNINLKPKERENITFHFLRGAIDFKSLKIHHALMMLTLKKILENKKTPTEDDKLILKNYGKKLDFLSKDSLNDLIKDIKSVTN